MRVMRQHPRIPPRHPRGYIPLHRNLKRSFVEPEQAERSRAHGNSDSMKNASMRGLSSSRTAVQLQGRTGDLAATATS
eukprot:9220331-Pyramimonas_sp.AAC.1